MSLWVHWLVSSHADTLEVGPNGAFRDLTSAIAEAQDGDRIEVEPGEYVGPVPLGNKELEIVSTEGSAVTTLVPVTFGGGYYEPSVYVNGSSPVTLRGFTLDGQGLANGMIVVNQGDVFADDLVFLGGTDRNLVVDRSTFTIVASAFVGAVGVDGGHVHVYDSVVDFDGVSFTKGHHGFSGGALYLTGSSGVFRHCTFADNEGSEGGALLIEAEAADAVTIEDSVFERNEALSGYGGAILQFGGQLTVVRTELRDNLAASGSGAIDHRYASLFRFEDGRLEGNAAPMGAGLGLYDASDAVILGSTFEANHTDGDGAAILVVGHTQRAEIAGNRFCTNTAGGVGGAVSLASYDSLVADVHNNVFVGNEAGFAGGAVAITDAELELAQNTIVDSSAPDDRGAVWVNWYASANLVNNAIVYSVGAAVAKEPDASGLAATYTLLFGNDRDLIGTASSDTTVEADPAFVSHLAGDCASDVHPGSGSALVDAGDPALLDDDGTRSDIGAYGGPGASTLVDVDGDGLIIGDCAPFDPVASAPSDEVPADGLDQDCDGQDLCYVDADGDGTGSDDTAVAALGCADAGFADVTGDCDDGDPSLILECGGSDPSPDPDDAASSPLPPLWFCATSPGTPSWPVLLWVGAWFAVRRAGRRDASADSLRRGKRAAKP